jgi:uncharacterized cupin superfamily protein
VIVFVLENVFADHYDVDQRQPGFSWKRMRLGRRLGAQQLGASVYRLEPGQRSFPFHFHHGNEEMLLVLEGEVGIRTTDGVIGAVPGDAMLFEPGAAGAHQIVNTGHGPARVLVVSGMTSPEVTEFPDSGKVGLFAGHAPGATQAGDLKRFVSCEDVDYFAGEPT